MSAPPVLTELKLSEDMKKAVNTAFERMKPIVISYIDENDAPKLSFRGSTQAYSDTALAIWVRDARRPDSRRREKESGRGADLRRLSNGRSRFHDFSRQGPASTRAKPPASASTRAPTPSSAARTRTARAMPLIIELDSVEGFFGGALLKMKR